MAPMLTFLHIHAFSLHGPVWRSDAWQARTGPDRHLNITPQPASNQLTLFGASQ